ncbi:SusC/RagA family TonB-linked outer membrane protein [Hymenobacter sp. NST-14]|uniref:SusC/RagA family TonB-linked outer membrane protein n=1 Tax=Hymenobacter piscis TaxID=2839984 RepID=UPI001C0277C1|nr:SusC/RagA family TonB-linked outer membrane protein [Hymenobacter piscis]MBT9395414.1 SusC/RagA family TonB-linked outer membrane protein [Hymenobacter piscis]
MLHLNSFLAARAPRLTGALLLSLGSAFGAQAQNSTREVAYFAVPAGPLTSALQQLQRQAGVSIVYEARDLQTSQVSATELRGARVGDILRQLLRNQPLRFEEKQGVIILQPTSPAAPAAPGKRAPQGRQVKGRVTEAGGAALPGVTVLVKGTTVGAVTNGAGEYTLDLPEGAETLVFSFVGYLAREVAVGEQATIDVALVQDAKLLSDVVVIGYGSVKKGEVTSAITSVDPREFNRGVVATPDQILQGKVAGLNITRSGDPNATASVVLRGASSLRTGQAQEPFYVIDGVPAASINLVAPDEIVSIEVLKDASATAIYGARAANGVILITTRRQKPSAAVSYSGYVGLEQVSNTLDMLSGDELRGYLEANSKSLSPADNDAGTNTDWQKEVMRTGLSHNHTVSYGGGSEKSAFNASLNYFKREGVMNTSDSERLIGKINLDQKTLQDKLQLRFTLTNSLLTQHLISELVYKNMFTHLPTTNIRNADGTYKENLTRTQYYNPVALLAQNHEERKINTLLGNASAQLTLLPNLTNTLSLSMQNEAVKGGSYQGRESPVPNAANVTGLAAKGLARRYSVENSRRILENYLTYNPLSTAAHNLKVLVGYSWQQDKNGDGFQTDTRGFVSDQLGYNNLALGNPGGVAPNYDAAIAGYSLGISTLRLISLYGRVNYGLRDRYFLQVSVRRDGSSAFGRNNRWGTFPAASLAWNLAGEDFLSGLSQLTELKLRVGYGITGNSLGFDPLIATQRYSSVGTFYYNVAFIKAIGPTQNPNPDLKWETTAMLNVGLDFGLWQNRLGGTVEYYDKRTSDLIWNYPVSTTQYFVNTLYANVGEISNKGLELTLSAQPVQTRSFQWSLTGTLAHNVNKVEKLANEQFRLDQVYTAYPGGSGQSGISTQVVKAGYPVGQFFLPEYAGRDENGLSLFYKADGTTTGSPTLNDYRYQGNAQPRLLYGLSNTVSWKNLDLNFFLRGVQGNKILNATLANLNIPAQSTANNLPAFSLTEPYADNRANYYSNRYLENGSYLRLDNVTLGYNLPLESEYVKRARVYLTSQNLLTLTNYRGIDPEMSLGGLTPGLDNNNFYPKTRSYVLGVNLDF